MSSLPVNKRESNFELLRIVSMLMILSLHSFCQDNISLASLNASVTVDFFREVSCICGPNLFVLISGYWGMKLGLKKFCWLLFELMFFVLGLYALAVVLGIESFNIKDFFCRLNALPVRYYWFVSVYIMLYVVSPVLNVFAEYATPKIFRNTLFLFFAFQTYYSMMPNAAIEFNGGYSLISMAGIYVLGRYLRLRIGKDFFLSFQKSRYAMLSGCLILLLTAYVIFARCILNTDHSFMVRNIWGGLTYHNPLVVIMSVSIFMFFAKLRISKFQNTINYIASSTLAVYLLHRSPDVKDIFNEFVFYLYNYNLIIHYISLAFLFVIIFAIAVVLNKICLVIYQLIFPYFEKSYKKVINYVFKENY